MEGMNNEKKTNVEMVAEIKKEYPKFKLFWDAVVEQTKNGKGEIHFGELPGPLNVVRLLASDLNNIKHLAGSYTSEFETNKDAMMPVQNYKQCMDILQRTLGRASDIYHGEIEILGKNGRLISQFNTED